MLATDERALSREPTTTRGSYGIGCLLALSAHQI
jgi:hypothetical protein